MGERSITHGSNDNTRAALVVAHPGHELRVHHWMETVRPLYFCLTDGSGRAGNSRMDSTSKLLRGVGATPGGIYGRFTDKEVYQALLAGPTGIFAELVKELAEALIAHDIETVAGDAPEGMNPTHDLCRFLIDEAVTVVERLTGRRVRNLEFVLDSPPTECREELKSQALWLRLDEEALERKLRAALDYPELRAETDEGLRLFGKQAFSVECLRPSTSRAALEACEKAPPAYERFGREGVVRHGKQFGRYEQIITFQQHVKPMVQSMEKAGAEWVPSPVGDPE
jgi:AcrR family transcriptional regulator